MSTEPVLIGNIVTLLFTLFGAFFIKYGITQDDINTFVGVIGTIVSGIVVVVSWIKQRKKVTPLVNPQDNDGNPLVAQT